MALWTLGQLVASTGYVVEPYRKYPTLLEVLLNFLKTEQNQGTRREVGTPISSSSEDFQELGGQSEKQAAESISSKRNGRPVAGAEWGIICFDGQGCKEAVNEVVHLQWNGKNWLAV